MKSRMQRICSGGWVVSVVFVTILVLGAFDFVGVASGADSGRLQPNRRRRKLPTDNLSPGPGLGR